MRPIAKKDMLTVYPVEVQSRFPWLLTSCQECGYPIAGPGEVYLKDAEPPFCRPECAWIWAKKTGLKPRAKPVKPKKPTTRKRLKAPQPLEQTTN